LKLAQLTRQHLIALMNEVTQQGLGKSMQNQIRAVLKPALDEAELEGYIEKTPWRAIKLSKPKSGNPDFFEIDEVIQILTTAESQGCLLRWQFYLIYGPRQGECLGLRWADLDLDADGPGVKFSSQIQRITGRGLVSVPLKTSNSNRRVPLSSKTAELFSIAREAHMTARAVNGPSWNPEGFVFVTPLGTPIDPANDRKAWLRLLKDAGVATKPLHTARHTAATHAEDLNVASKMLGHSSIRVTADFYAAAPTKSMLASIGKYEEKITRNN
jgi:integrase